MPPVSPFRQIAAAMVFALAVAAAAVIGSLAVPDAASQYRSLEQPSWAPPSSVFGPVWTALYLTIALAAWLVWRRVGWDHRLSVWGVQLVFNAAWTPLFFGLGELGLALADIFILWLLIGAMVVVFWQVSRPAALLLIPYWLWVTFAGALNFEIWRLNA